MRFLSVCSGIEAASVAWKPLGWSPYVLAEIEPFPREVLMHRHQAHDARIDAVHGRAQQRNECCT